MIGSLDDELRLRRTAADGWQQCLSVKTLKAFLWLRWVVSPFTETILSCLLILFLPVYAKSSCSLFAIDCRYLEAAVSDVSGSPSLGSELAMHTIIAQNSPKHQSRVCGFIHV